MVLADDAGLAYISGYGAEPIPITRANNYWQGHVPVSREGASLMAAARDDLGRLRVLDGMAQTSTHGFWMPTARMLTKKGQRYIYRMKNAFSV